MTAAPILQHLFDQQLIPCIDAANAVILFLRIIVHRKEYIPNKSRWTAEPQLRCRGVRITNGKRHLVIEVLLPFIARKSTSRKRIDLSDIHVITAPQQFQINNIFQNMPGV